MASEAKIVKKGHEHKLLFEKSRKKGKFILQNLGKCEINLNTKKTNYNHPGRTGQIQNLLHHILILQGSNSRF